MTKCKFCPRQATTVYRGTWNVCEFCKNAMEVGIEIGTAVGARLVLNKGRKVKERNHATTVGQDSRQTN